MKLPSSPSTQKLFLDILQLESSYSSVVNDSNDKTFNPTFVYEQLQTFHHQGQNLLYRYDSSTQQLCYLLRWRIVFNTIVEIDSLIVARHHRTPGKLRSFMKAIIQFLVPHKHRIFRTEVYTSNLVSIQLHGRLGFREYVSTTNKQGYEIEGEVLMNRLFASFLFEPGLTK
jgi:predicted GNAT superfamily acetyltransferase